MKTKKWKGTLSKSTLLRSLQCQKSLYLHKHHSELRDEISDSQEAIFKQGTEIGILAQKLFPNGVDLYDDNHFEFQSKIDKTAKAIADEETTLYEAAFLADNLYCAVDILRKEDGAWHIYEVKSSTEVKDVYLLDTAIQLYVLQEAGLKVNDISLVHINNQYERQGDLEITKLFHIESVMAQAESLLPEVANWIGDARNTLRSAEIPNHEIGPHCDDPYSCDFKGYCWKEIPEYSIFNISRLRGDKKFELYYKDIVELKDVPRDFPLNANQWLQIDSELSNRTHIDHTQIHEFVKSLNYPLYFLDFETINPAIPSFNKCRPYQKIPFQYSLHILNKPNGKLIHREFLGDGKTDPRVPLAQKLINDIRDSGDILAYNMGFEKSVMRQLGELFPEFDEALQQRIERVRDLMTPFQKRWYYSPDMRGSYSIKKVLPALVPELTYKDLAISDGGMAMDAYEALSYEENEDTRERIRRNLLAYCRLDTMAMVDILRVLEKV